MNLEEILALHKDFHSAAAVLRNWQKSDYVRLKVNDSDGQLNAFFSLLAQVENDLTEKQTNRPFIILVEGLDGSGKSTLVRFLAGQAFSVGGLSCATYAVKTPPASASAVRHIFDTCDNLVSRAFYAVCNYILQHEMRLISDKHPLALFFVDRWYASTCAYSVGWAQSAGAKNIYELEPSTFEWPADLDIPDLLIVPRVEHDVRKVRIETRSEVNVSNPWDSRLSSDENLAQRIMQSLERIARPLEAIFVQADKPTEEVQQTCRSLVQERASWAFAPLQLLKENPLQLLQWMSSRIGLCDQQTGFRLQDKLWGHTLSVRTKSSETAVIRNLTVDCIDNNGILSLSASLPNDLGVVHSCCFASASWYFGNNPAFSRWQANGMIRIISEYETDMNKPAEDSSRKLWLKSAVEQQSRDQLVEEGQSSSTGTDSYRKVSIRLIPAQMTVQVGSADCCSTDTQGFDWVRDKQRDGSGWCEAQQISPGAARNSIPHICALRPITIAILGTHTAGKTTIGKKVADILQWKFESELGDILREKDLLVQGGHRTGDGRGGFDHESKTWDNQVHMAECARDEAARWCRVVETWHVGNAAWALLRAKSIGEAKDNEQEIINRARVAIKGELRKAVVLLVHLRVDTETMILRRKFPGNSKRLPMKDEARECAELHEALDEHGSEVVSSFAEVGIPVLRVENRVDGKAAVERIVENIVEFANCNMWRMMA